MCIGILLACMFVHPMSPLCWRRPEEGNWILWNWSYSWVLGRAVGVVLTAEPSLQPLSIDVLMCHPNEFDIYCFVLVHFRMTDLGFL